MPVHYLCSRTAGLCPADEGDVEYRRSEWWSLDVSFVG